MIGATFLIAIWMLAGGALHILKPEAFFSVVPDVLPKLTVVYVSGTVELVIGAAVVFPRTRAWAGLAFAALCLSFLPLHVWDFFRTGPVFEPPVWASVRCGVQILVMLIGWRLWQVSQSRSKVTDDGRPRLPGHRDGKAAG